MSGILAIDTASPHGIALAYRRSPGATVEAVTIDGGRDHSRQLVAAIETLVGSDKENLEAVGVVVGPGSYAGLRVGIATAESIGLGLGVPVFGATTFEAAARYAGSATLLVHPAGRGEFAVVLLDDGQPVGPPMPMPEAELTGNAAGEGAGAFGGVEISPEDRARAVVAIVEKRLTAGERPPGIEAYYLREPNITRPKRTPLIAH